MLGRLGWHGQCSCCNGPDGKQEIKRQEDRAWRREALDEMVRDAEAHGMYEATSGTPEAMR